MENNNSKPAEKKESIFYNLLLNIILPAIILSKYSGPEKIGPLYGLLLALAFPLAYGIFDIAINKKRNFISILGFASILLTGVIGLLKFPPEWIAVKEASIPLLIGIILLVSIFTPLNLLNRLIYNKDILNIEAIELSLNERNNTNGISKVLKNATLFLSFSFFVSALLNYILAKIVVHSAPGTTQFNAELGKMALLSYPVIALPSLIILSLIFWYLLSSLKKLTGLTTELLLAEKLRDKK